MANDKRIDSAAAAAAAAAALAAARRRAEEAARRAAEAARKIAEAAAQQAAAAQSQAKAAAGVEKLGISARTSGRGFKGADELSTGKGSALRNQSLSAIGSPQGGPVAAAPAGNVDPSLLPAFLRNRVQFANAVLPSQTPAAAVQGPAAVVQPPAQSDVDAATAHVQQAARDNPANAVTVAREEAEKLNDPAKVDELIKRTQPELDAAAKVATDPDKVNDFITLSQKAGKPGVEQLASSLAAVLDKNRTLDPNGELDPNGSPSDHQAAYVIANVLIGRFGDGEGLALAAAVSQKVPNNPDAAALLNSQLDAHLGNVRGEYDQKLEAYQKDQARLSDDLQAFGPALTDEQKQKYSEEFWKQPEHAMVKSEVERAESNLAYTLEQCRPALESRAAKGDQDAAHQLTDCVERLAKSDHYADDALKWIKDVGAPGNEALANALDKATDGGLEKWATEKVVEQAIPRAQAEALGAAEKGDPAAIEGFEGLLKSFEAVGPLKKLSDTVKKAGATLEQVRKAPDVETAKQAIAGFKDSTTLEKTFKMATAVMAFYKAGTSPDQVDQLKEAIRGSKDVVELSAGLLNTIGRAEGGAKFLEKFVPYLGAAADAIQTGQDVTNFDRDNPGDYLKLTGDGLSLLGDALTAVPGVGVVFKEVLAVAGAAVHAVGDLITDLVKGAEEQQKVSKERALLLEKAGVDQGTRDLLNGLDPTTEARLGKLGLTREQAVDALKFLSSGDPSVTRASLDAAAAMGLRGGDALDFARQLSPTLDATSAEELEVQLGQVGTIAADQARRGESDLRTYEGTYQVVQAMLQRANPDLYQRLHLGDKRPEDINTDYFVVTTR